MRNVFMPCFMRCVFLLTLWGTSLGLAGCLSPDRNESSSTVPLIGTSWTLVSLGGREITDGPAMTLRFAAEGTLGGFDGCNSYRGKFSIDGSALHIPRDMAATRAACQEPIVSKANAYVEALMRAASHAIDGDRLQLLDSAGQEVAAFEALSLTLIGTSWEVSGYNNGNQAVVSVLQGTHITAHFGEDGRITGSAGCNQYFTSYKAATELISIDMPAMTRMSCTEPGDIMEQATRYLKALSMATSFRFDGDKLVLRNEDAALAVTLVRARGVESPAGKISDASRILFSPGT